MQIGFQMGARMGLILEITPDLGLIPGDVTEAARAATLQSTKLSSSAFSDRLSAQSRLSPGPVPMPRQAAARKPAGGERKRMSLAEARRIAASENLRLLTRAGSDSGFVNVYRRSQGNGERSSRPWEARVRAEERNVSLGRYASAAEAALAVARHLGPEAST